MSCSKIQMFSGSNIRSLPWFLLAMMLVTIVCVSSVRHRHPLAGGKGHEAPLGSDLQSMTNFLPGALAGESTISSYFGISKISVAQSSGNKFYVSKAGSNNSSGSMNAPWRTIMHALNRAQAGDIVVVRGGTFSENVTFPRSGRSEAPITLTAYPGEKSILDGTGLPIRDCFTVTTQSYITIDGFVIRNCQANGVKGFGFVQWDDVAVTGITLRNLEIYNVGIPIKVAASGGSAMRSSITIENVQAHDYPLGGIDLGPGPVANVTIRRTQLLGVSSGNETSYDGIAVEKGSGTFLLEDVFVQGHLGDGIDLKADNITLRRCEVRNPGRNGLKLWGGNTLVQGCWVSGSRSGLGALVLGGAGVYTIRDNVILNTGGDKGTMNSYSIEIGVFGSKESDPPTLLTIAGNTFHAEGNGGVLINLYNNARIQRDSDYNTYYSQRQDTIFSGARDSMGRLMEVVTPAAINEGAWSRFVRAEQHSRFSARLPVKSPSVWAEGVGIDGPVLAPAKQRPRRVGLP